MTDEPNTDDLPPPVEKRRGRPPGTPKTGGRQPGSPNKVKLALNVRQQMLEKGKPVELLTDIARGKPVRIGPQAGPGEPELHYPTFNERLSAARDLLKYCVPQLQAMQVSGPNDGPIQTEHLEYTSDRAIARSILDIFRTANAEGQPAAKWVDPKSGIATIDMGQAIPAHHLDRLGELDRSAQQASPADRADPARGDGGLATAASRQEGALLADAAPSTPALWDGNIASLASHRRLDQGRPDERPPPGMTGEDTLTTGRFMEGERLLVGEAGHALEYIMQGNDNRTKWWILDQHGMRVATCWGQQQATEMVETLIRTGKVSR